MANVLTFDKQVSIISMLAEGASNRGIERMTGVHRDTVMRLGVRVGQACAGFMDEKMRGLTCQRIEVDELWAFIRKKQGNCIAADFAKGCGDAYTYVALDSETKLIPAFRVGRRDYINTNLFMGDLAARIKNRPQVTTDGLIHYKSAVETAWGVNVDYGQIVKSYDGQGAMEHEAARRYSAPAVVSTKRIIMAGSPDMAKISTSFVEKQNHTVRMHCRRLSRLTNAFSKKLDHFKAAVALHFAYYNFVKFHQTIRCTPAMAAGVEKSALTVADLVAIAR